MTRVSSRSRAARLREIAKAGAGEAPPRPPRQCPACLAVESWHTEHDQMVSSLARNGLCVDRAACEGRMPPLF